jgi:hypothetical protein
MSGTTIHLTATIKNSRTRTWQQKERLRFKRQFARLSPSRGEDEGEGFERTRPGSTPTLLLSLGEGEATHKHGLCENSSNRDR